MPLGKVWLLGNFISELLLFKGGEPYTPPIVIRCTIDAGWVKAETFFASAGVHPTAGNRAVAIRRAGM